MFHVKHWPPFFRIYINIFPAWEEGIKPLPFSGLPFFFDIQGRGFNFHGDPAHHFQVIPFQAF